MTLTGWRDLPRDEGGVVAIEAAAVLPVVIFCLLAIVDGILLGIAASALEHSAWTVHRLMMEGATDTQALEAARQEMARVFAPGASGLTLEGDSLRLQLRVIGAISRRIFGIGPLSASVSGASLGDG